MNLNFYLPWYLNILFLLVSFVTILWQTYYCQLLFSVELKNKWRTFMMEGMVVTIPCILLFLVEANYSYIFLLFVLPIIWWRIWDNTQNFKRLYYDNINYNTYKQAWDSLPMPVAIANEQQEIILVNEAMHDFIRNNLHIKVRNLKKLWQQLESPEDKAITVIKEQGHLVLQLPRGKDYWAELEGLRLEGIPYFQLTLTDISDQDKQITSERTCIEVDSEKQGLNQLLNNLDEIKRQEVAEELHGRMHDFMGQRIAILQRLLSQKDNADYSKLVPLLENVLQDMRTADLQTPEEQLQNIIKSFQTLGLDLRLQGELPQRQDWAQCFVNMIREGATNAVRHGEATLVEVNIILKAMSAEITVTSNGRAPAEFEKGKGLQGMEKAFQNLGGCLDIIVAKDFILRGRVGVNADEAINS